MTSNNNVTDEMKRKRRIEFDEDLVGVVLVYCFGNPSTKPGTAWEKLTYNTVQNIIPDNNESKEYFWKHCGTDIIYNICTKELEELIISHILDIRVDEYYHNRTLRNNNIQSFNTTCGILNKELYFMTKKSCQRILKQRGYPKNIIIIIQQVLHGV